MPDTSSAPSKGPNCWQCQFFAVSWDPRMPYACHRMGFKSPVMPALEVLRTDGQPCRGFAPKPAAAAPAPARAALAGERAAPASSLTSTRQWQA